MYDDPKFDCADCVKTIVKEEGILGFYKGFLPAILLTSHGAIQVC